MDALMPKLSVLMLTYNRPGWLHQAIRSILASRNVDMELIVCDNGSESWETREVLGAYRDHPQVRSWRIEHNDIERAKATCVRDARGEYAMWFPDDDVICDVDWLSDACRLLDVSTAGLVWSHMETMSADGQRLGEIKGQKFYTATFDREFPANAIPMSACVFRSKYLHAPSLKMRYFGEMDLFLRILYESEGLCIPRVTTLVRLHEATESVAGYRNGGFLEAHMKIWRYWIEERGYRPSEEVIKEMTQTWAGMMIPAGAGPERATEFIELLKGAA